jgi:hypothetical protein
MKASLHVNGRSVARAFKCKNTQDIALSRRVSPNLNELHIHETALYHNVGWNTAGNSISWIPTAHFFLPPKEDARVDPRLKAGDGHDEKLDTLPFSP